MIWGRPVGYLWRPLKEKRRALWNSKLVGQRAATAIMTVKDAKS